VAIAAREGMMFAKWEERQMQIIGGVLGGIAASLIPSLGPTLDWNPFWAGVTGFFLGSCVGAFIDHLGKRADAEGKKKLGS